MSASAFLRWLVQLIAATPEPLIEFDAPDDVPEGTEAIEVRLRGRRFQIRVEEVG